MIPKFLSAKDSIIGQTVYDSVEEKVGVIQDLFINPDTNKPVFVTMEEGGFLGIGSDTYALPWAMLEFNTNSGSVLLEVRKNKVADAPELDVNKLKNYDRQEVRKLTEYYGTSDFSSKDGVDQENYQAKRNTNHPHQGYEGSAKVTGEGSQSTPMDEVDYEKAKGLK